MLRNLTMNLRQINALGCFQMFGCGKEIIFHKGFVKFRITIGRLTLKHSTNNLGYSCVSINCPQVSQKTIFLPYFPSSNLLKGLLKIYVHYRLNLSPGPLYFSSPWGKRMDTRNNVESLSRVCENNLDSQFAFACKIRKGTFRLDHKHFNYSLPLG